MKPKKIKSQANIIGMVIVFSMFLVGILVFYNKLSKRMIENSQMLLLSEAKKKGAEISEVLNDVIKYKSTREVIWDINDFLFLVEGFYNFSYLNINTKIKDEMPFEVVYGNKPYREICLIDSTSGKLHGCLLEGYYLNNLTNFCKERNGVYYCQNNVIYSKKDYKGKKYLISLLPSPKLNIISNKLCNAYLLNFRGSIRIIFVCDFYYQNGVCYFPYFKPGFVAFNNLDEPTKIIVKYEGTQKMDFNPYPFCKKSYKILISFNKNE